MKKKATQQEREIATAKNKPMAKEPKPSIQQNGEAQPRKPRTSKK